MSSGFSFGLPSSSSNTSGFSFGGGGGTSGGGLNLGGLKPLGSSLTSNAPATNPAPAGTGSGLNLSGLSTGSTGFSLGGGGGTGTGTTASTGSTAPTTTTGLNLNLGGNSTAPSTTTTSSGGLGGLGLGLGLGGGGSSLTGTNLMGTSGTSATSALGALSSAASAAASASASAASSSAPTASSGSSSQAPITFKVLEDYINKWMSDLDAQEKDFLNQATQLNALDKLMVENGDKIIDLSNEVTRLTNDQDQLEQELNFIHSQQNDLEQAIRKLEQGIENMPLILPQQQQYQASPYSQSAMMISGDTSRIEMYKLLVEVDNQLKSTSCDVRDIVKRLNDTNVNLNDPIVQISKILNSHMDSLNWIEENSVMLQAQVDKVAKLIDERYREPDSSTSRFMFLARD